MQGYIRGSVGPSITDHYEGKWMPLRSAIAGALVRAVWGYS
jgi:hypothetical protein